MCGIVGAFNSNGRAVEPGLLRAMSERIVHRGPDDDGYFVRENAGLGFRRLSIIDLDGGHQPIANENGDVHVILNGEIYNFRALREELESAGHRFQSRSDTEVIVHLYEEVGRGFVNRLRGMFAIAILDLRENRLLLARDRMGIKPLYYWEGQGELAFASEIKCLFAHPSISAQLRQESLFEYFALRYTLGPETLFEGIRKLPPATLMEVTADGTTQDRYWSPIVQSEGMISNAGEAAETVRSAFADSVKHHLESDVPIGIFLSGGLDSSAVLAEASQHYGNRLKTFTVNFGVGGEVDETEYARAAAKKFSSEHTDLFVEPPDPSILEKLIWHMDEPIGDPAILPTFLMSELAAKEVKVVLTGEGSDEVNGGYNRYATYARYLEVAKYLPRSKTLLGLLNRIPPFKGRLDNLMPLRTAPNELQRLLLHLCGERVDVAKRVLNQDISSGFYDKLEKRMQAAPEDELERLLHLDRQTWMVEDLLMKVDRMTMAHSLEARPPFLDHCYLEAALRIPSRLKVANGTTKKVLRDAYGDVLPQQIAGRRQHGFNVPLHKWFKGEFQTMVGDLLSGERMSRRGVLAAGEVEKITARYLEDGSGSTTIWMLVMLELWFQQFID